MTCIPVQACAEVFPYNWINAPRITRVDKRSLTTLWWIVWYHFRLCDIHLTKEKSMVMHPRCPTPNLRLMAQTHYTRTGQGQGRGTGWAQQKTVGYVLPIRWPYLIVSNGGGGNADPRGCGPPRCRSPLDADPPDAEPLPLDADPPPPVNRQTGVKR